MVRSSFKISRAGSGINDRVMRWNLHGFSPEVLKHVFTQLILNSNWDFQAQTFWERIGSSLPSTQVDKPRELLEQKWVKQSENYWTELAHLRSIKLPQISSNNV